MLREIVVGTIIATSLMTIFSYMYSEISKKQFREPELLNNLMARLHWIGPTAWPRHWLGWLIHYWVGLVFVATYHLSGIVNDLGDYVVAGAACGVIGILGWRVTFSLHPGPPALNVKEYYAQLFVAHIVFGAGAFLGDLLL